MGFVTLSSVQRKVLQDIPKFKGGRQANSSGHIFLFCKYLGGLYELLGEQLWYSVLLSRISAKPTPLQGRTKSPSVDLLASAYHKNGFCCKPQTSAGKAAPCEEAHSCRHPCETAKLPRSAAISLAEQLFQVALLSALATRERSAAL